LRAKFENFKELLESEEKFVLTFKENYEFDQNCRNFQENEIFDFFVEFFYES